MACFADVNVSQGIVATHARCGGTFNIHLIADLPRNLQVKKFLKSVEIWQNYGHESVAPFFWPILYIKIAQQTITVQDFTFKIDSFFFNFFAR